MSVEIIIGDALTELLMMPSDSVDCCVTSPPYWGLRDYGVAGQLGLEPTLGEHLAAMVAVFQEVRRILKPAGSLWLNYGDCYATTPNGRSAAATKAAGNDDRTFRDKPFSTIGPIFEHDDSPRQRSRRGRSGNLGNGGKNGVGIPDGRVAGGYLKPKDLCMIPNRLAIALQDAGWWVRAENVWGKRNPMPDSSGRYRPSTAHEKVFMLSKSGRCFYDAEAVARKCSPNTHARLAQDVANQVGSERANGGRKTNGNMKAVIRTPKQTAAGSGIKNNDSFNNAVCMPVETRYLRNYEPAPLDVWDIPTVSFSEAHFATFPPELAERCILAGCPAGGVVMDPFFGAGTVGMVAAKLGRPCIGIELNPEYADMARSRIRADLGRVAMQLPEKAAAGPLFDAMEAA